MNRRKPTIQDYRQDPTYQENPQNPLFQDYPVIVQSPTSSQSPTNPQSPPQYKRPQSSDIRLPLSEKYALTIKEACAYFNIGNKRMRRLAETNLGHFAVENGSRYLIIRPKFEEFMAKSSAI